MRVQRSFALGGFLCASTTLVCAIDLDVNNAQSVLSASKTIAANVVGYFNKSGIPGLPPQPYYWWEGGLALNSLIDYYSASGDESVVETIQSGLLWQSEPNSNFMPPNQTNLEGNDDQATWGLAAMTAAEYGFPQKAGQNVSWLQMASNVFESQVPRWDTSTCHGGLRWQIFAFNNGYNYKNFESQGSLAQLSARLARYTGNSTYSDWAEKIIQWCMDVDLIDTKAYAVFDGASTTNQCGEVNRLGWTINNGLLLGTSAYALNATGSSFWNPIIPGVVDNTMQYFTQNNNSVIYESACAPEKNCNSDQLAFRAVLARGLAQAKNFLNGTDTTSSVMQDITSLIQASAQGAAAQCSGGSDGTTCGSNWTSTTWDGTSGLGQEISALQIILANLASKPMEKGNSINASSIATANETSTTSGASMPSNTGTSGASSLMSYHMYGSIAVAGLIGSLVLL